MLNNIGISEINKLKELYPDNYKELLDNVNKGYPIQYLIGNVEFLNTIINVNKNVLIPRYETELLVDKTIKYLKQYYNHEIDILDIGTGSGCIAIALAKNINCKIDACDISNEALNLAKKNNLENSTQVTFIESDIFSNINKKYDCIISNPPYIDYNDLIDPVVKNNEPHLALFAQNNGLYFYDQILKHIADYLKDKYFIAFEIGSKQKNDIINIANKYLENAKVWCEKDYCDSDRFIFITNSETVTN